ncbi:MAG TPA: group 1 truncated hemoglobin [Actinopolymorphaceae bacterium]
MPNPGNFGNTGVAEPISDYQRIGGSPAVTAVVNRFYELILADPHLTHFFEGVDLVRLKRHQVLLVSQVLGGPAQYTGRDLESAHAHLPISSDDFGRVVNHLVAALREANVDPDIIARVGVALAGTEKDVVNVTTG